MKKPGSVLRWVVAGVIVLACLAGGVLLMETMMPLQNYEGKRFVAIHADVYDAETGKPLEDVYHEVRARHGPPVVRQRVEEGSAVVGILLPARGEQSLLRRDLMVDTMGFQITAIKKGYEPVSVPLNDETAVIDLEAETFPFNDAHSLNKELRLSPAQSTVTDEDVAQATATQPADGEDADAAAEEEADTTSTAPPPDLMDKIDGIGVE